MSSSLRAVARACAASLLISSVVHGADVYRFSHLAGTLTGAGSTDGMGGSARFSYPQGTAVDSKGNVFVADQRNQTIRRISPTGEVTTFAGKAGDFWGQDGMGVAARFTQPTGIAIDSDDCLYVCDNGSSIVRKITPDGNVTTLAGTWGLSGSADGVGSAARFYSPHAVAVDKAKNVYVGDDGCIRKISPAGVVTTFAGRQGVYGSADGVGTAARFSIISGLAIDSAGDLFASDSNNRTIRRITPAGVVTTFVGATGVADLVDGDSAGARLWSPSGMVFDVAGNLFLADSGSIRRITSAGVVTTVTGDMPADARQDYGFADGAPGLARFQSVFGVAIDTAGTLYVADSGNEAIRKVTREGVVTTLAGGPALRGSTDARGGLARFQGPAAIAVDADGIVYVADTSNHTIRKITVDGSVSTLAGRPPAFGNADGTGDAARFFSPAGIAVNAAGTVFVSDQSNQTIRKITPAGEVSTFAGAVGERGFVDGLAQNARFNTPGRLAVDAAGALYVAMRGGVRKISPAGEVSTLYRSNSPDDVIAAVAVHASGNVYFTDSTNYWVGRIAPDGNVSSLAGAFGQVGLDDGFGSAARFLQPSGIAVNAEGTVFVADWWAGTIRSIGPDGRVTTIGGVARRFGNADGLGDEAAFNTPSGLAVDRSGTLYITDSNNHSIRKGWSVNRGTRLANIAARTYCATGNGVTIGGFVIGGTGTKRVLIRAVGPTLVSQGLGATEVLADPMIELHQGAPVVAQNDDWLDQPNAAEIMAVGAQFGANPLAPSDTKSSALLVNLTPGAYTFLVRGKSNSSGIVLLEVYDVDEGNPTARFVNIATRALSTTANGVAIGGFVIAGSSAKQVLLRGVGPTLSALGLPATEVLADPAIELHRQAPTIAAADNWGELSDSGSIATTGARIGATAFSVADSKSPALLMTLNPGAYTFVAKGNSGQTGIVLVEVYDAD